MRDSSGLVLPGVVVEARSPSLPGVGTAVTDERGVHRFPALPPASYTVTATLQGFNPARADDVVLLLAGQGSIVGPGGQRWNSSSP